MQKIVAIVIESSDIFTEKLIAGVSKIEMLDGKSVRFNQFED